MDNKKENQKSKGLTRRDFLKDAGLASGAILGAGVLLASCKAEEITKTVQVPTTVTSTAPGATVTAPGNTVTSTAAGPTVTAPGVTITKTTPAEAADLKKALGYVLYNPDHCAGCRTCMNVCSLFHEGEVNLELSRIQINGTLLEPFDFDAITCRQCEGPECVYNCPTGAMHIDEKTGARVSDPEKCIGCKTCILACPKYPNAPIRFVTSKNIVIKCDLCGGDPQCVKFCPMSVSFSPSCYPVNEHPLKFVKY